MKANWWGQTWGAAFPLWLVLDMSASFVKERWIDAVSFRIQFNASA
jgi:hypothetical protein